MKGSYLGEFEEIILLLVVKLGEEAYGLAIRNEFNDQTSRSAAIGAVHSALSRLADKGFLNSKMASGTSERGGRRKRIFFITTAGKAALEHSRDLRNSIWNQIPQVNWETVEFVSAK